MAEIMTIFIRFVLLLRYLMVKAVVSLVWNIFSQDCYLMDTSRDNNLTPEHSEDVLDWNS